MVIKEAAYAPAYGGDRKLVRKPVEQVYGKEDY